MDVKPRNWTRIEELFAEAIELPPEEIPEFLDRRCRSDEALRDQLNGLLLADAEESSALDAGVAQEAVELLDLTDPEVEPHTQIGSYEVLREIGRGGMSRVYLARRADGEYRQRVAIKVIRRLWSNDFGIDHLKRERQILAGLDHPNIARLLDGGTTRDGLPYLVMEYIEGDPVDQYCRRKGLDLRQRLELFAPICSAVQRAHQQLVVHRDLKPSNILVTPAGVPKLLDFGIAKLLAPSAGAAASATATGFGAMTPRYASPEQVSGGPITTATDVFGLGAVLYELLTGRPPHRIDGGSPAEVVRAVCETRPDPPSLAVRRTPDPRTEPERDPDSASDPAVLRTQPARLARQLSGDLDNIALEALRKQPERRYASPAHLAADLRRYLDGRPVRARRATLFYRLGKFAQRHRVGMCMATFAVLLLSLSAWAIVAEAEKTARQRDLAEIEREKAEEVSTFMVDLFGMVGSAAERSADVSARDLVDRGAQRVRNELGHQPEALASALTALGIGYRKMGLYSSAEELLEEALQIRRERLGPDHLDTASSLHELGFLNLDLARYDLAGEQLRKGQEIREAHLASEHPIVAESLLGLAKLALYAGDPHQAQQLCEEALGILEETLEPDHPEIARALHGIGNSVRRQGDYAAAVPYLRRALAIRQEALGAEHSDVAINLHDLGAVLGRLGEYEEAEVLLERSMNLLRQSWGPGHPHLAQAAQSLATLAQNQGDFERAETLYRDAIAIMEAATGEEHHVVAVMTHNLGYVYYRKGDYEQAEPLLRRATAIGEKVLGGDHPHLTYSLHYLGAIARERGQFERAAAYLERSLGIRRTSSPDHPSLATSLIEIALLRRAQGETEEAEQLLDEALAIREEALGPDHPDVAAVLHALADLHLHQARFDSAAALGQRTVEIRQDSLDAEHPDLLASQTLVARIDRALELRRQ